MIFDVYFVTQLQDSANVLYSESQGMVILYLQGILHSRFFQELFWGLCKGVPLEVGFECMKKGLTWTI